MVVILILENFILFYFWDFELYGKDEEEYLWNKVNKIRESIFLVRIW